MTSVSETAEHWFGLCRKAPTLRTAPTILAVQPVTVNPAQSGSRGAVGESGRIRRGIDIATGSIRTLFRERHLLWFSLLAGLVIFFLFVAEGWSVTHYDYLPLPYSIWIPIGNASLVVFNMQLFLIEAICLSCFTCLLAGMILYRNESRAKKPVTIRNAFAGVNAHAGTLAPLSISMAFVATLVFELISQSQLISGFLHTIDMALFYLPYAYYVPNGVTSMYYFSFRIMIINIVLFLLALYVVPGIVLESKRLLPALVGSVTLMKKTWRELLGCILIFGAILLMVAAVALLIGQSPLLLNHDYDFFLQVSRGQILMTIACYGFLLGCCVLMALGSTVLGVAITDLYSYGKTNSTTPSRENTSPAVAEPAR
ncbi:hypothetical protein [Methanoregula sp.]|uniref:hypothetical protein n=1 Tax=Methanoregula sp. TaxID=2052170 RepID=UPI002375CCD0|nr:hypothetical protein [Methanoregula sp.]MDD1687547.1 hypothetical protein [Methanoregula sp.]